MSLCDSVPLDDTCRLSAPTRSGPGPLPSAREGLVVPIVPCPHGRGDPHGSRSPSLTIIRTTCGSWVAGHPLGYALHRTCATGHPRRPTMSPRAVDGDRTGHRDRFETGPGTHPCDRQPVRAAWVPAERDGGEAPVRGALHKPGHRLQPTGATDHPRPSWISAHCGYPAGCSRQRTARPHPDNRTAVVAVQDHHEARPRIATIGIATVPGGRASPAGGRLRAAVPVAESCTEPARPTHRTNGIASGRRAKQR